MIIQKTFKDATLRTVNNGFIELDCENKVHCFHNASIVSINDGVITIQIEWIPKNGELVKVEGDGCIPHYIIFTSQNNHMLYGYGYVNANFNPYGNNKFDYFVWQLGYKTKLLPVTSEEVSAFNDFCKSKGKIWNKEKLQWEKYRWKPIKGTKYFHVLIVGGVIQIDSYIWMDDSTDENYYKAGNCFRTKEEAEAKLEQIKKLLLEV